MKRFLIIGLLWLAVGQTRAQDFARHYVGLGYTNGYFSESYTYGGLYSGFQEVSFSGMSLQYHYRFHKNLYATFATFKANRDIDPDKSKRVFDLGIRYNPIVRWRFQPSFGLSFTPRLNEGALTLSSGFDIHLGSRWVLCLKAQMKTGSEHYAIWYHPSVLFKL